MNWLKRAIARLLGRRKRRGEESTKPKARVLADSTKTAKIDSIQARAAKRRKKSPRRTPPPKKPSKLISGKTERMAKCMAECMKGVDKKDKLYDSLLKGCRAECNQRVGAGG